MEVAMTDETQPGALLTGGRQTMMTWSRVAESLDEVPEAFREACRALVGSRPVFPYVVYAPPMGGTRPRNYERLLCDVDDTLYIVERVGRRLTTVGYPWKAARDIEYGNSLLYSWITLSGQTTQGVDDASTVTFNLATARHYRPLISKVRPASAPADEAKLSAEQAKFDGLVKSSFKFASFARESLVPGETVLQTVWQPALRRQVASVLGWPLYRSVSLAHLTVLTDREVILICDEEQSAKKGKARYGGVWRYVPLRHVLSASILETPEGFLTLSLGLTGSGRIERIYAVASRAALEQFQSALEALIKR
jgi:hypothetical protein